MPRIHTVIDKPTAQRLKSFGEFHQVPDSRVVRRLLQMIPFEKLDEIQVVISIKKGLLQDREALLAALQEATAMLMNELPLDG